mmetsp:Transcript_18687/g.24264  ORF Transcript_18687/g.24264 Transcript_18687/m.24264 type:complete len:98 (+) Transcript_18687:30-323(+)
MIIYIEVSRGAQAGLFPPPTDRRRLLASLSLILREAGCGPGGGGRAPLVFRRSFGRWNTHPLVDAVSMSFLKRFGDGDNFFTELRQAEDIAGNNGRS